MRLTCPCCGATLSLEALLNDVAARQAVATALALPANLGPRLLRYLGLFRPPQRSLTWERAAALLSELQALIDAGQIRRNGRSWSASPTVWAAALDALLERQNLSLPLKSHGYLFEIIVGMADRVEAEQERKIEAQRRTARPDADTGMQTVAALPNNAKKTMQIPEYGNSMTQAPKQPVPASTPKRSAPPAKFSSLARTLRGRSAELPEGKDDATA